MIGKNCLKIFKRNLKHFSRGRKGMIVAHYFDYIFIVFIALFGFIFIYISFITVVDQRDEASLKAVNGVNEVQQHIVENRIKFENGEDIDVIKILQQKRYLQKYGSLTNEKSSDEVQESVGLMEI